MRVWHRLIDRGTASTDKPGQGPESGMGPGPGPGPGSYRSRSGLRVMRPFVVNGTKIMGEKTQTGLLMRHRPTWRRWLAMEEEAPPSL